MKMWAIIAVLSLQSLSALSFVEDQTLNRKLIEKLGYSHETDIKEMCQDLNSELSARTADLLVTHVDISVDQINAKAVYRIEQRYGRGANLQHAHICELKIRLTSNDYKIVESSLPKVKGTGRAKICDEQLALLETEGNMLYGDIFKGLRSCQVSSIRIEK